MHLGRFLVLLVVEEVTVFELKDEGEELLVVLVLVPGLAVLNGLHHLAHDGPFSHRHRTRLVDLRAIYLILNLPTALYSYHHWISLLHSSVVGHDSHIQRALSFFALVDGSLKAIDPELPFYSRASPQNVVTLNRTHQEFKLKFWLESVFVPFGVHFHHFDIENVGEGLVLSLDENILFIVVVLELLLEAEQLLLEVDGHEDVEELFLHDFCLLRLFV